MICHNQLFRNTLHEEKFRYWHTFYIIFNVIFYFITSEYEKISEEEEEYENNSDEIEENDTDDESVSDECEISSNRSTQLEKGMVVRNQSRKY